MLFLVTSSWPQLRLPHGHHGSPVAGTEMDVPRETSHMATHAIILSFEDMA